ncbi:27361_t:CDS:2, partial [Gigaspora margarita]
LDIQEDKEFKKSQQRKVLLLEAESSCIDYGIEELEKYANMRKVTEKKDTQEETEKNLYQYKEVAINIIYMATKNQEITHNPLQIDQILLDIDTGNTKDFLLVTKEKLTTYTLWDLPQLFNNGQVKRLIERYGKVQEICWTCEKFSKQAHITLSEKNEKSKKMLKDSWVLPIGKGLTRITVGNNQEEDLKIRKQHKLTLYSLPRNIAEVLLLRQVRHLKTKAVYIPVNANFNPGRSAFVYFSSNEDLLRAYKSKVNYRNSLLYWKFCKWAESKNNPIQQEGAETSSRYKSKIKEKKTTSKENNNTMKNLNTRRMIHKNNLSNENEEKSSCSKNESLNATLQEILNRLKKIESSYSSSRAIANPDTRRVNEKTQEGLGGANLKDKEKEYLTDDVENIMKDRFTKINKAEGSKKIKTSKDY